MNEIVLNDLLAQHKLDLNKWNHYIEYRSYISSDDERAEDERKYFTVHEKFIMDEVYETLFNNNKEITVDSELDIDEICKIDDIIPDEINNKVETNEELLAKVLKIVLQLYEKNPNYLRQFVKNAFVSINMKEYIDDKFEDNKEKVQNAWSALNLYFINKKKTHLEKIKKYSSDYNISEDDLKSLVGKKNNLLREIKKF